MASKEQKQIAVIGGGAAGFFAAIRAAERNPDAKVLLLEKSSKLLSKVKVSGGGRCNVTNAETKISELVKAYPRGGRQMKKLLRQFSTPDTVKWFKHRGVALHTEADGRMFPTTNDSQTIIDCLMNAANKAGVEIRTNAQVKSIRKHNNSFELLLANGKVLYADKVIIASGGSPKRSGLKWLEDLGHQIEEPVPSLFTFNIPNKELHNLMGLSVPDATISIQGSKFRASGPLLITHWGMSGPAVLKLSAFAARELAEMNYEFNIQVSWLNEPNDEAVRQLLKDLFAGKNKKLGNLRPADIPDRLWNYLLQRAEVNSDTSASELKSKSLNRLTDILCRDVYEVKGKTTFKEEFVTCGGISLQDVNIQSMESKIVPGMYFAGEVLNIDAITGGYNFQAAWTTGFVAGGMSSE